MNFGLRLRVTLWSVAANALVLLAGTVLLFWLLDQQLTGALDGALSAQATATAVAVESWLSSQKPKVSLVLTGALTEGLKDLFTEPKDVPASLPTMTSLLDTNGQVLLSTHVPNAVDVPDAEVLKVARSGSVHRSLATVIDASDQKNTFRVATVPVHLDGEVQGFVQVLSPVEALRGTLSQVQGLLMAAVAVLLVAGAWLVSLALKRALLPVDRLVADIRRITAKNLSVRVPVPATPDEIQRLSVTFNAMLDRLDRGFQFQTRLFQDLSHQLKTPLAILTGTLETALTQVRTGDVYQTILESNLDEVSRMSHLIENLLLLARLDSQQLILQTRVVDLGHFCRQWVEDFSLLLSSKDLAPVWQVSGPLPVALDADRLGQALLNLLDNAVKYSPSGGFVTFRLHEQAGFALLEVENQGPELEPGTEETIFERFTKMADGRPGYGLGLPIARAAVELHGGRLVAYNPASGGAGFRLSLPIDRGSSSNKNNLIGN
ncbi:MAG: ATP-binding protein [Spirochaetales bacterium]